jgi:multiple sugar transport system permease protein
MGRSSVHYWFVGPAIILMVLLLIAPVIVAAALSMTDYSLGNSGFNWIGWENYEKLFSRRSYSKMFTASLTYVIVVVPISLKASLVIWCLTGL